MALALLQQLAAAAREAPNGQIKETAADRAMLKTKIKMRKMALQRVGSRNNQVLSTHR